MRCILPNFESKRLGKIFRSWSLQAEALKPLLINTLQGAQLLWGLRSINVASTCARWLCAPFPHGQPCTSLAALGTALVAPHPLPLLWL